jgi:hypothetical protein
MSADENPNGVPRHEAPANVDELHGASRKRRTGFFQIFLAGVVIGAGSFYAAIASISQDLVSPTDHDLRLANNLGFIYPPLVGFWIGMVRRSLWWICLGVAGGVLIGRLYKALCSDEFLAVMVAYPCLLGGVMSSMLGRGERSWQDGVWSRFMKGLVAGFALGFLYMVILNVGALFLMPFYASMDKYVWMMWRAGPIAMSIASGAYFLLLHWSANLGSDPVTRRLDVRS